MRITSLEPTSSQYLKLVPPEKLIETHPAILRGFSKHRHEAIAWIHRSTDSHPYKIEVRAHCDTHRSNNANIARKECNCKKNLPEFHICMTRTREIRDNVSATADKRSSTRTSDRALKKSWNSAEFPWARDAGTCSGLKNCMTVHQTGDQRVRKLGAWLFSTNKPSGWRQFGILSRVHWKFIVFSKFMVPGAFKL